MASGFSYAQAARGQASASTSQTPSSKVTSGTATPATGTISELTPSSNWADDIEATVGDKTRVATVESSATTDMKESGSERPKPANKLPNGTADASSPDVASTAQSNTKDHDVPATANGVTSETASDTKSQASEPAWITERKERQNGTHANEASVTGESDSKAGSTPTPAKPAVLLESAPPTVNPWMKRAEENKAKLAAVPQTAATVPPADTTAAPKENHKPRAELQRKEQTSTTAAKELQSSASSETKKTGGVTGKRTGEVRAPTSRQTTKSASPAEAAASKPAPTATWATSSERPTASAAPLPSVKDESSWPTPDTAQGKERKESVDKDNAEEKVGDDDSTPATKRKKQEWKVMPVVPNVIWETPSMNESKERRLRGVGGERAGRGGARGRGGLRGGANGVHGGGERNGPKSSPSGHDTESQSGTRGRAAAADRESMPPPPKPTRASSAHAYRGRTADAATGRKNSSVEVDTKAAEPSMTGVPLSKSLSETRRAKSPKKANAIPSGAKNDDSLPKPIPRRSSVDGPIGGAVEGGKQPAQDAPAVTSGQQEVRKDSRSFENSRELPWTAPLRGGKRSGRGRGGNGNGNRPPDLANGHPPAGSPFGNSFSADFTGAPPFGVPPSPSTFNASRGNHQPPYPPPGRGGWRGNPRSQSIPVDNFYGRYPAQYGPQGHLAPLQTYGPGVYDYGTYPMSAVPYQPFVDQSWLLDMLSTQLEYYFSIDNLVKDLFMRKHMDTQGFIFLDVIANFNRIKQLTQDRELIKAVCINSEHIEIRAGEDGKERLRRREGWGQFVLPMDQRESPAQTEGPQQLHHLERPQLYGNPALAFRGPSSAGLSPQQRGDRNASYPMMNGFPGSYGTFGPVPDGSYGDMPNGEELRGRTVKSPVHANASASHLSVSAAEEQDVEPDAFPDDQANVLTVVVKMSDQQRVPFHSAASRTFSNGSIDSKSIMADPEESTKESSKPAANIETLANGDEQRQSRHSSPHNTSSLERGQNTAEMQFFWVKDQDVPVDNLPSGLSSEPYVQLRLKALDQRNHAATGTCPYDLDVLYQFWCHFLLRNFNNRMYSEFKYYANEDARERHNLTGLNNLIKFYSEALNSHTPIRERVVKDYVALVKTEPAKLEGAAFKQLRSAWRNGALNLKNRKKLSDIIDDGLKTQLDRTEP